MDRCPTCRSQMDFYGISVTRDLWSRWLECRACGTFVACDSNGAPIVIQKKQPRIDGSVA